MKLGVFQSACAGLDPRERIGRLDQVITGQDLDLVVCPELFLSGYNVGTDLKRLAEPVDGPSAGAVAQLAQWHGTAIVYGYSEAVDDRLYNSAACITADGNLAANHRKRANSPGSFEEDYFTPGSVPTVFELAGVSVAILICYEVEFPETVRQAARMGAQLVVVPTALVAQWDVVASRIVPARAFENGIWLAYANHAGHENGSTYLGGSRIVAPSGQEAAVAGGDEALIVAEIDIAQVAAAQKRLPYLRDCALFTPNPTPNRGD